MKIRPLTQDTYPKALALLRQAFTGSRYEERLVDNLHKNKRQTYEWVCIHRNMVIGYICFTNAYNDDQICGLHLAPLAINPQFQGQGIGTELVRFALRQKELAQKTIYVLGDPAYYQRFGFSRITQPICPFDTNNKHFLAQHPAEDDTFTVGYEPEFSIGS